MSEKGAVLWLIYLQKLIPSCAGDYASNYEIESRHFYSYSLIFPNSFRGYCALTAGF